MARKPKTTKKKVESGPANEPESIALLPYDIYLSNGEFFARLTYSLSYIVEKFPGAKIVGSTIYDAKIYLA